ncbi:Clp protease N-terminal domain-containing protein [Ktedonospora formicarum]|uniref:Clp R domain-containing protein n=1 Tax=Ktedonospora formicarum TaxID=2778364 RepID=A0A8J3MU88_9CHLR|nr:Clp protease N-terminal domain-containing protein [Ktedonospora formicarum]GHO46378.1 hypothetical protein KSX_45410 [Ktedonospora formicarum]
MKPLLTSDELAEILKVDVVTIRRLVNRQEITAYRIGNEFRFTESDLEGYLQRQRLPAREEGNNLPGRFSGFLRKILGGAGQGDRFNFTKRALKVISLAYEESLELELNYVGTEHLLLGMLKEGEGIAALALREQRVSYEQVYELVKGINSESQSDLNKVGLTTRAKKVIKLSVDEAKRLGHAFIGTEHLLLSILREGEGLACGILKELMSEEKYTQLSEEVIQKAKLRRETQGKYAGVEEARQLLLNDEGKGLPCVNCGEFCPDHFKYCSNCGSRLREE